ncbi:aminopeptidase [Deinococcus hopiensis]|uniref:Leucyl aminopeptidase (Aminopeptidase T) n=1 Tax=Deinococcus hopiensis KR-140 TaxID=695939 RepID=A0A1W1VEI4_9DEIO|nr:aminopeptidase [Deinococcus hopiensis]SMB91623.1 Leucyl aminopeptidase (aminopeptidase T) [Deinococcus hopiensis KR-140]
MQTTPEGVPTGTLTYDPVPHAALLADYCLSAGEGDRLLVAGGTGALPLVREVTRAFLRRGARPVVRLEYPGQDEDWAALASGAVLDQTHAADLVDAEALDGSLRILTPEPDPRGDAARRARLTAARAPLATLRARKKWSLTLFPTAHAAAQAGMTEAEFGAFVMRAMFLDRPDPVAAWGEVRTMQAELIKRLTRADVVRIEAPGTDLTLRVGGRTWANSDGRRNMPSGEVFTGPVEHSAEGVVTFTVPASYAGQMVRGARLVFRTGEVVEASAEEGEEVLRAALATDPGARRLGELGIGTNSGIQAPTGNILFDEKIGGTVHLALGRSYPETGGVNASAIHWDLITDLRRGGRLSLDGEVMQEGGVFRR